MPRVKVDARASEVVKIVSAFSHLSDKASRLITECGNVSIDGAAKGDKHNVRFDGDINTALGKLEVRGKLADIFGKRLNFSGRLATNKFMLGRMLNNESVFGDVALDAEVEAKVNGKQINGKLDGEVPYIDVKGYRYNNIIANVVLDGDMLDGTVTIDDDNLQA